MRKRMLRGSVLGLLAMWCFSTGSAQPKLAVTDQEVNLGTVYNGGIVKAKVKLQNTGKETLKILGIRTSCGCTTVKHPKSELAPGESDFVEVEFNSSGFRGKAVKYIGIETNDPANQYTSITLSADVKEELQPVNNYSLIWFGDVPVGQRAEQMYALRNITKSRITIRGVTKADPELGIYFDKKIVAPSDSVVLKVSVTPEKSGYANEVFFVETDSKNQPRVPVRVSFVGVTRK
ncbi:MAG: DUF1573 domain-containing protein [Ignavibacteriales bacterium]|nr:DUF1573 domain-containing protein [Ignavibacteriales bacterium]